VKYITHSHRDAETILSTPEHIAVYEEIKAVLNEITDEDIISKHSEKYSLKMSLSYAINDLLRDGFRKKKWSLESYIFQDDKYHDNKWRLDFAKGTVSIEVAFNHGEAIAWNLVKPVLASELNHVKKAIQTKVGVIITAAESMKRAGAFDSAVGEFEKFLRYLTPMGQILTAPLLVIGIQAPESFHVKKLKVGGRNVGRIIRKVS